MKKEGIHKGHTCPLSSNIYFEAPAFPKWFDDETKKRVETDATENKKPSKKRPTERIDRGVETVMGLDRVIRNMNATPRTFMIKKELLWYDLCYFI